MDMNLPTRVNGRDESLSRDAIDRIVDDSDCVVFDFYKTLSSDLFFRPLGESTLGRIQSLLWGQDQRFFDRWMAGEVSASAVADYLSGHLGISAGEIEAALREGCRELEFNEAVWEFAKAVRAAGKPMALVTVNADVFSEEVVPSFGLDRVFDVIVNSADHGDTDKRRLWPVAFEALGGGISYAATFTVWLDQRGGR